MLANAAFCSSLQGHVFPMRVAGRVPPAAAAAGQAEEADVIDSPSSLRRRVDVVDRGRISGTQKV